jgi:hypothetical protein
MPPTLFGTGANSAIAGGIRIIIRYGISWICSASGDGKETDTARKQQVIEDEEPIKE